MIPTFYALIVALAGVLGSTNFVMRMQLLLCVFGATSAVDLPALGGAVIQPAVLFLPFLIFRAWLETRRRKYLHHVPAAGAWLALLAVWIVVGAVFIPRLLEGRVEILTVDRISGVPEPALFPLQPVSGNITQTGYAIGALGAFLAMRALLAAPGRLLVYRDGVLALAALNVAAALLNLAEFHLGLPSLLEEYVRTASYAMFKAYEIEGTGLMRIQGTFSETSTFCTFSLPLFAFTFNLWLHGVRPGYSGLLAACLFVLLMISTSTTAYVGVTAYLSLLGFVLIRRGYLRGSIPRFAMLLSGVLLALVLVGSAFVLETGIADNLVNYLQITVFNKLETSSGVERGSWNRQAWSNFVDTFGLGVGMGSARASSFALVLLSNVGLLGTLMFIAFMYKALRPSPHAPFEPVSEASRHAVYAATLAACASAAVFDLGIAFYAFAAAASFTLPGVVARRESPRQQAPSLIRSA